MDKAREKIIIDRAGKNRAFLHIHGFLTDAENEKVKHRINKRFTKHINRKYK